MLFKKHYDYHSFAFVFSLLGNGMWPVMITLSPIHPQDTKLELDKKELSLALSKLIARIVALRVN